MSDKIKLNVTMKCKADSYRQANNLCVVEEIVPVPDADFLEMETFPCRDNPYIKLHKDSMFADSEAILKKVKTRFPVVNKYPILFPGAVLYWLFCYVFKCIKGKRKLLKNNDIKAGKERNKLYKQFRLFK